MSTTNDTQAQNNIVSPAGVIIYEHIWEPDHVRTLKDGRKVGSDKYNLTWAVDPDTDEFEKFVALLARAANTEPRVMLKMLNEAFQFAGGRFDGLDPTWIVLKASTKFTLPIFDRKGRHVDKGGAYPGSTVRALVSPFIYDSSLLRKKAISLRLKGVLVVDPGSPRAFSKAADPRAMFGEFLESGGEEMPF